MDTHKPYAEVWFGTHRSGVSDVEMSSGAVPLTTYLEQIAGQDSPELPFLVKVLSIDAPLSIQLHPTKAQAQKLHEADPVNYPDTNHKPEVGVALTPVSMLYGFKELEHVADFLKRAGLVLPEPVALGTTLQVKPLVDFLYALSPESVEKAVTTLSACRTPETPPETWTCEEWLKFLTKSWPSSDPALLLFGCLNLVVLPVGCYVFTPPGVPHAYLSGDLLECMACSDNTVRAGLTDKHRDLDVFSALAVTKTTSQLPPRYPAQLTDSSYLIECETDDFVVEHIIGPTMHDLRLTHPGPQIIICTQGAAHLKASDITGTITTGQAMVVCSGQLDYTITSSTDCKLFRCYSR